MIAVVKGFLRSLGYGDSTVNLLLTDDATLRELNGRYRGIAAPTDILSWSYRDDQAEPELLGELERSELLVNGISPFSNSSSSRGCQRRRNFSASAITFSRRSPSRVSPKRALSSVFTAAFQSFEFIDLPVPKV